jgi:hypothetical protein
MAPNDSLWHRIKSFNPGGSGAEFSFQDRLARENGWSGLYAARAIWEYKKFMYLICRSDTALTPSEQVDQVWHLHLLYTQDYWIDFCESTLGKTIHHGPTKGGSEERHKYTTAYEVTLRKYENVFLFVSPEDIWPKTKDRFKQRNFRRVNLHRYWIFAKPRFLQK